MSVIAEHDYNVIRICFLISGLGMGNSTRCHAVIQRLRKEGATVDLVTSGNGIAYFSLRPEVDRLFEVAELFYGSKDDRISIALTLGSLPEYRRILRRNTNQITEFLEERRPDAVVTDSFYVSAPMRRLGIPIVAINNADAVFRDFYRYRARPWAIFPQFFAVEQMDFLYHKVVADLVISPALMPTQPKRSGKFLSVGPLVREGYASKEPLDTAESALVMLSGSVFGSPVNIVNEDLPFKVEVVGRDGPANVPDNRKITYHGKLMDNRSLVREADIAVVNGGFSAVSEMFALRKPMVVVPVPRHAEQWINARRIVEMGVGKMASEESFEIAMIALAERVGDFQAAYSKLPPAEDGARDAAQAILDTAEGHRP